LDIGVLKILAHVWPVANTVLGQVKTVAEEMLILKRAMSPSYWGSFGRDDILRDIEGDGGLADLGQDAYGGQQTQ